MKKFVLLILILGLALTSACSNNKANKEKYDEAINQVIIWENKDLQTNGIYSNKDILERKDAGIVVYKKGKYIELFYKTPSNKEIESLYERGKGGIYKKYSNKDLKAIDEDLKESSYTENVGKK
ncbi:cystatin-like fold lipoprotein [Priestia flexa]|uniref:cystatin-like fold lipoprotein n=1 Tax=Priestia flexa TaxID=86664 RepID=UPI0004731326|nr:cystatin-like fold lipoprotein [Priestia flexa]MCM3068475.1 cystatin-like fold lipoprotein [Priestia flexa]MED3825233.1 cystatin-like fold lipoprotein [Priestia flexa]